MTDYTGIASHNDEDMIRYCDIIVILLISYDRLSMFNVDYMSPDYQYPGVQPISSPRSTATCLLISISHLTAQTSAAQT